MYFPKSETDVNDKHHWNLLLDVEIMEYLGVLVTRRYFKSKKILSEITAYFVMNIAL